MLECEVSWVKGVVDRSEDSGIGEFRVGIALKDKVGPFWKFGLLYLCKTRADSVFNFYYCPKDPGRNPVQDRKQS